MPASTSVAHEAAGTETSSTGAGNINYTYPSSGVLDTNKMVGVGPALTAASILAGPNANHASSLSPATNPTLTSIATIASGGGTGTCTATGTNFTRQSVLNVNGISYPTTFASADDDHRHHCQEGDAGHAAGLRHYRRCRSNCTVNWTFYMTKKKHDEERDEHDERDEAERHEQRQRTRGCSFPRPHRNRVTRSIVNSASRTEYGSSSRSRRKHPVKSKLAYAAACRVVSVYGLNQRTADGFVAGSGRHGSSEAVDQFDQPDRVRRSATRISRFMSVVKTSSGTACINFAGQDEPTTLNEDGTLSTGVNMAMWQGPDTVPVVIKNGPESLGSG